jgi:alpha-L-rhamnosidase
VTWPASTVLVPGHLHTQFGDTGVLERHYPSMRKWVDYLAGFLEDDLMPRDTYGDWCVPPEDPKLIHSQDPARKTHPTILATTYYVHCLNQMTRYAGLLGRPDDAARDRALAARLTTALNARFFDAQRGCYDNGSQTACVLPLALGFVPEGQGSRVFAQLVSKIANESRNHIGTGLVGGQWLMRTLTAHGRADLAYTLAANRTYPSWGYMVDRGATTIWELWNGDTADPAMNSGNHVMLVGDLVLWMYEGLAGIKSDPEQPGFKRVLMEPHPVGDLSYVKATHRSPYGLIASEWRRDGGRFTWRVSVPPNTTAWIRLPADGPQKITEGGKPVGGAEGLRELGVQNGRVALEAQPGNYVFEVAP